MKVFIADDSLIVRQRLVDMCNDLACAEVIGQAQSVPDAIEGIESLNPHVVILDAQMPGGNGIDVVHRLKSGVSRPFVIMLTNYAYAAFRQRCLATGVDFFLDKSKEFEQLPAVLRRLEKLNSSKWLEAGLPAK